MSDTAATFCATLVDEWVRAGVTRAVAAPGSRSTPMALALAGDDRLALDVFHDERSAAFAALGHAMATGRPTVVTCTSGTAAAHLHAAVIEADLSAVPLLVVTTDRPPELWQTGAPQTVDQTGLYGRSVRQFVEPGVPNEAMRGSWRSLAAQAVAAAMGGTGVAGPVHCNLSFRDPLVGQPGPLPPGRPGDEPWHLDRRTTGAEETIGDAELDRLWARIRGLSGVIVAGHGTTDPAAVLAVGRRLGWPVLADPRSGCRAEGRAIAHFDGLLRSSTFAAASRPDVVLRLGQPPASKALSQWLAGLDADIVAAVDRGRWIDPERIASMIVPEAGLARGLATRIPADYRPATEAERWARADAVADKVIAEELAAIDRDDRVSEPGVARAVVDGLPSGGTLVVASSMPIRDVEWFAAGRQDVRVLASRGANGIDGLVATATGVALSGAPTTLLIGDVAFLHDSPGLVALGRRAVDLTIVVVDNDGGGIFSFLPQADQVAPDRFEQLFGTPHGTDLIALCLAHGVPAEPWTGGLDGGAGGVRVLVATTDRTDNVAVHDQLNRAIIAAVER
ncbi:MAG: 2-succinyl-5-enolpyruvyl-6-hydroxy-3-cyclohexene-1-carboxylic-acid synthase [Actinomycetota bacterium]